MFWLYAERERGRNEKTLEMHSAILNATQELK